MGEQHGQPGLGDRLQTYRPQSVLSGVTPRSCCRPVLAGRAEALGGLSISVLSPRRLPGRPTMRSDGEDPRHRHQTRPASSSSLHSRPGTRRGLSPGRVRTRPPCRTGHRRSALRRGPGPALASGGARIPWGALTWGSTGKQAGVGCPGRKFLDPAPHGAPTRVGQDTVWQYPSPWATWSSGPGRGRDHSEGGAHHGVPKASNPQRKPPTRLRDGGLGARALWVFTWVRPAQGPHQVTALLSPS